LVFKICTYSSAVLVLKPKTTVFLENRLKLNDWNEWMFDDGLTLWLAVFIVMFIQIMI